jgi:hypothetical protein
VLEPGHALLGGQGRFERVLQRLQGTLVDHPLGEPRRSGDDGLGRPLHLVERPVVLLVLDRQLPRYLGQDVGADRVEELVLVVRMLSQHGHDLGDGVRELGAVVRVAVVGRPGEDDGFEKALAQPLVDHGVEVGAGTRIVRRVRSASTSIARGTTG